MSNVNLTKTVPADWHKKTLAYEVTKLVHGVERADSVKRISEVLFGV